MTKQLRDFIAVAGARARWLRADVKNTADWSPAFREYASKRDEYKREHGVFLTFLEVA